MKDIGLPPPDVHSNPESPMMDSRDYELRLNALDEEGWEFVGFGQKWWNARDHPETVWIFRQPAEAGD